MVRLSDQEHSVLVATKQSEFPHLPLGAVVERACRSLLAEDPEDENGGVHLG